MVPTIHASGVQVDAEGLPWDSRIHATTKNKTQKGVWKARKGLNDEGLVNRVKAELKALMAMPVAPVVQMRVPVIANDDTAGTRNIVEKLTETINIRPPTPEETTMMTSFVAAQAMPVPPVAIEPPPVPPYIGAPAVPTVMPVPPAPAPTGVPSTMLELMPRVTSAVLANKLPQNALLDAVVAVGMPSIPSLQQRPDMVPEVWNRLNALYPGVLV